MRTKIQALEQEIPSLRARLGEQMAKDERLQGMPENGVRVGMPTALARTLIQTVVAGFVDSVTRLAVAYFARPAHRTALNRA